MPSHQERVKRNYPTCFETGHNYVIICDSNIAPFIELDGRRTTIKSCIECGKKNYYTRTQEEFLKEIEILNR